MRGSSRTAPVAWELSLESIFYRTLCGYESASAGQEALAAGAYYRTIAAASSAVHGHHQYLLWHNPAAVIARCQAHINGGRQELVIASHQARLGHFASVRHRITHGQEDARQNFDAATLVVAGRTCPASSAGRFLRDSPAGIHPRQTYLDILCGELHGLVAQIV